MAVVDIIIISNIYIELAAQHCFTRILHVVKYVYHLSHKLKPMVEMWYPGEWHISM